MSKYVAFLRAINVGGKKIIKMEVLRQIFESLGFVNVTTYIQTGNIIFDARLKNPESVRSRIENGLKSALGFEVDAVVVSFAELVSLVQKDPFQQIESSDEAVLFVTFLAPKPTSTPTLPLVSATENVEVIAIEDWAAIIVARRKKNGRFGFPNNFIEKKFGVIGTTRYWETVKKLAAMEAPKASSQK